VSQLSKGLEPGSLFKFCFIGLFFFSIAIAIAGTIGGALFSDSWNGPQGVHEITSTVNNEIITNEKVETSSGISSLFSFALVVPITTAISAGMIWFFLLIGQYVYSMFKPITLIINEKGLSLTSSFKLCVIGWCCSVVPLSLLSTIVGIIETGNLESFKISGEPMTPVLAIILSLIFIPLINVICASILGISIFLGQRLFSFIKPLDLKVIEFTPK
jgi:hypothetical protein